VRSGVIRIPPGLQRDQSLPLDRQLRDRVAQMIVDGVIQEGDRLPLLGDLGEELGLTPVIVLRAYQHLFDEQLVEK
jgi:GntR family transcriptional regulator